jgi:hypothetical protein
VIYALAISPESAADEMEDTFSRMVESLRVNERTTHRAAKSRGARRR